MKPFWKTKKFQVRWNEPLGRKECPYAYRWVFIFFGYSIRVHRWLRSDDKRYKHNHPWWFITFVIKGEYTDVARLSETIDLYDQVKTFQFRYRKSNHTHYVVPIPNTWTILLTGKPLNKWGFWIRGRYLRPLRYFKRFGNPPCNEL